MSLGSKTITGQDIKGEKEIWTLRHKQKSQQLEMRESIRRREGWFENMVAWEKEVDFETQACIATESVPWRIWI